MKKNYQLLVLLLCAAGLHAQLILSPEFKTSLLYPAEYDLYFGLDGNPIDIDANGDGEIDSSEAQSVYKLEIVTPSALPFFNMSGIEAFINLSELRAGSLGNVQNFNIGGLVNLKKVYCNGDNLQSLDLSGLGDLEELNVSNNEMATVALDPTAPIKELDLSYNPGILSNISSFPFLEVFNCSANEMNSVDFAAMPNLKELDCSHNNIADLGSLPNLTRLSCGYNQLTELDISNLSQIKNLSYSFNPDMAAIDVNSLTTLESLGCSGTGLSELHVENLLGLHSLDCTDNHLSTLDLSNNLLLIQIKCSNNQLVTLDLNASPNLAYVYCSDNNLTSIFMKNKPYGSMAWPLLETFNLSGNPLEYLCVDEDLVDYFQALPEYFVPATAEINSYCPFDPAINYSIAPVLLFDADGNGCTADETFSGNVLYSIAGPYSNTQQYYLGQSIPTYVSSGLYTVIPQLENPDYFTVSPQNSQAELSETANVFNPQFCIEANGSHPDLEILQFGNIGRPGDNSTYFVLLRNKGNSEQSGTVTLAYDGTHTDFINASPIPASQSGNTLEWGFSDLQPFESRYYLYHFHIHSPSDTPAVHAGDTLFSTVYASSLSVDETPADNSFTFEQQIKSSYDPNNKTCLEGTIVSPEIVGDYVHYIIRFENTGTAPAQNVVVKDIIDADKYDVASIVPLSASHDYRLQVFGQRAEFIFENINLPFGQGDNDGYIVFKIKTKSTLLIGESFSNSAEIYFDYNFPVLTEPAVTTIQQLAVSDFDFSDNFELFPNPASDNFSIWSKSGLEIRSLEVYNNIGQLMMASTAVLNGQRIDIAKLPTGNYFVKLRSSRGTAIGKLIKK